MILVEDFKLDGNWVNSKTVEGVRLITRAGRLWGSIKTRTKRGGSFNTYHSTTEQAENGFKDFQSFADWCQTQHNYMFLDLEGRLYQLDKDIKGRGDKWYSPGTCAFIPQHINKLLNEQKSKVGDLPLGVSYHKKSGKYSSKISSFNRRIWLGLHDCPQEASLLYRKAKHNEIVRLLDTYGVDELGREVFLELGNRARRYMTNTGERE